MAAAAGGGSRLATMVQRFDGTNYEDWKSNVEVSIMIEEHVVKEEQEVKSTDVEDADNGRYARLS